MVISGPETPTHDHVEPIESVPIVGGELCLDFANTTSQRQSGSPSERLRSYGDLVVWTERVGLVSAAEARGLVRAAQARPAAAERALERALDLRETVYRIFSAVATGEAPSPEDLAALNAVLREDQPRRQLTSSGIGFDWAWAEGREPLEGMLGPVAYSAAELLTSGELERVKECTNQSCNWLFLDASRNRSRRWCDMRDCGNREKARRHYAKRKTADGT